MGSLLLSYPNLVQVRCENSRSMENNAPQALEHVDERSPLEHFVHFFSIQNNGQPPSDVQLELIRRVVQEAEVEIHAPD